MYSTVSAPHGTILIGATAGGDAQTEVVGNYVGKEDGRDVWDKVNITLNYQTWAKMSANDRARALLHELGHAFNLLAGAGGSAFLDDNKPDGTPDMDKQRSNADLEKKCIP